MIIKYYYKGWNIIDGVSNIKIIKKLTGEILKKANDLGEGLYIPNKGESQESITYNKLCSQTINEVEELLEERPNSTKFAIESEFVDRNMFEGHGEYYTVLVYTENNQLKCLIFSERAFILNNEGKTIEKI